jgi:hypothetical protein
VPSRAAPSATEALRRFVVFNLLSVLFGKSDIAMAAIVREGRRAA